MDAHERLRALLELTEQIGLTVRRMPNLTGDGDRTGGALVRIQGEEVLFVDPLAAVADQTAFVAGVLAGRRELQSRFVAPQLRECIAACASSDEIEP